MPKILLLFVSSLLLPLTLHATSPLLESLYVPLMKQNLCSSSEDCKAKRYIKESGWLGVEKISIYEGSEITQETLREILKAALLYYKESPSDRQVKIVAYRGSYQETGWWDKAYMEVEIAERESNSPPPWWVPQEIEDYLVWLPFALVLLWVLIREIKYRRRLRKGASTQEISKKRSYLKKAFFTLLGLLAYYLLWVKHGLLFLLAIPLWMGSIFLSGLIASMDGDLTRAQEERVAADVSKMLKERGYYLCNAKKILGSTYKGCYDYRSYGGPPRIYDTYCALGHDVGILSDLIMTYRASYDTLEEKVTMTAKLSPYACGFDRVSEERPYLILKLKRR